MDVDITDKESQMISSQMIVSMSLEQTYHHEQKKVKLFLSKGYGLNHVSYIDDISYSMDLLEFSC